MDYVEYLNANCLERKDGWVVFKMINCDYPLEDRSVYDDPGTVIKAKKIKCNIWRTDEMDKYPVDTIWTCLIRYEWIGEVRSIDDKKNEIICGKLQLLERCQPIIRKRIEEKAPEDFEFMYTSRQGGRLETYYKKKGSGPWKNSHG